jgi:mannosyltransferase
VDTIWDAPAGRRLLVVAALTLVPAVIAGVTIGRRSLWFDEAISVAIARQDLGSVLHTISTREANMALYYVLLHGWLGLGQDEVTIRQLSLLAAVATIPIFFSLAGRLFGAWVAVGGTLLLGLNGFFLEFAQEARGYSLAVLAAVAASWLLIWAAEAPSPRRWLAYALVAAASLYVHFFCAFVVLAHAIALSLGRRERIHTPWRTLVATFGLIGLLGLPLVAFLALGSGPEIEWVGAVSARGLARVADSLTGHGGPPLIVGYAIASLTAVTWLVRRPATAAREFGWPVLFALSWLVVPMVATLAVSIVKPVLVDRFLLPAVPALCLLAAACMTRLRPIAAGAALVGVLVVGTGVAAIRHMTSVEKEDWRAAAGAVLAESAATDGAVFVAPYVHTPFAYYVRRFGQEGRAPEPIYPRLAWATAGIVPEALRHDPVGTVHGAAPGYARVWLIVSHAGQAGDEVAKAVVDELTARFHEERTWQFEGVQIYLYVKSGASSDCAGPSVSATRRSASARRPAAASA